MRNLEAAKFSPKPWGHLHPSTPSGTRDSCNIPKVSWVLLRILLRFVSFATCLKLGGLHVGVMKVGMVAATDELYVLALIPGKRPRHVGNPQASQVLQAQMLHVLSIPGNPNSPKYILTCFRPRKKYCLHTNSAVQTSPGLWKLVCSLSESLTWSCYKTLLKFMVCRRGLNNHQLSIHVLDVSTTSNIPQNDVFKHFSSCLRAQVQLQVQGDMVELGKCLETSPASVQAEVSYPLPLRGRG